MSVRSETIKISTPEDDGPSSSFLAFLLRPPQGSGPGLIFITENLNINQEIEKETITLSEEGYVVLVPDLSSFSSDDKYMITCIERAIHRLTSVPERIGKIGIIGRGKGGDIAIQLMTKASHDQRNPCLIDCGVAYYPTMFEDHVPDLMKIQVPFVIHMPVDEKSNVTNFIDQIKQSSNNVEIFKYEKIPHGFAAPENQNSAEIRGITRIAYTRSLNVLKKILGPYFDLSALWDKHMEYEFETKNVQMTVSTMTNEAYVNHVPTMTGAVGHKQIAQFYEHHFIHCNPPDGRIIPISRTIGLDRLVDEMVFCFTHTQEVDWVLPGVAPTNKYVEIPLVVIVNFRGDKLHSEHIYWDQASVLAQIGLLNKEGLPITGAEQAKK
ncbi:20087_t:CDS:2, partial [Dentiscutata erythropus]